MLQLMITWDIHAGFHGNLRRTAPEYCQVKVVRQSLSRVKDGTSDGLDSSGFDGMDSQQS